MEGEAASLGAWLVPGRPWRGDPGSAAPPWCPRFLVSGPAEHRMTLFRSLYPSLSRGLRCWETLSSRVYTAAHFRALLIFPGASAATRC